MQKKKTRILIAARDVNHGQVYQRVHIIFKLLRDKYEIHSRNIDSIQLCDLHYFDILVIPHPYTFMELALISKAKSQYGCKVIIDVDDLLTGLPTDHEFFGSFKANNVAEILQYADFIVYSTEYLASKYGHMNTRYAVIPNCIDPTRYNFHMPPHPSKNAFMIGWTGSGYHKADQYETFLNGLVKVLREYHDIKAWFHLLCPDPVYREFGSQIIFEPLPVSHLDYALFSKTYPFDVCLVGLDDCEFNHAKSDLRLIEMGILGIPVICSPRSDFIQHKDKGICWYADDKDSAFKSWYELMKHAKENPEETKALGQKARNYVLSNRANFHMAPLWERVIERVAWA